MPRRGRFRLHGVEIKGKGEGRRASFIVAKENAAAKNSCSTGRERKYEKVKGINTSRGKRGGRTASFIVATEKR